MVRVLVVVALDGATDSRADHHHEAVAEGADANHEVGQRQPELQQTDGPLVVVVAVEQD